MPLFGGGGTVPLAGGGGGAVPILGLYPHCVQNFVSLVHPHLGQMEEVELTGEAVGGEMGGAGRMKLEEVEGRGGAGRIAPGTGGFGPCGVGGAYEVGVEDATTVLPRGEGGGEIERVDAFNLTPLKAGVEDVSDADDPVVNDVDPPDTDRS